MSNCSTDQGCTFLHSKFLLKLNANSEQSELFETMAASKISRLKNTTFFCFVNKMENIIIF